MICKKNGNIAPLPTFSVLSKYCAPTGGGIEHIEAIDTIDAIDKSLVKIFWCVRGGGKRNEGYPYVEKGKPSFVV